MYDFVYLCVRRSVRDSHRSRDYRDGTGIRIFYENPGFYKVLNLMQPVLQIKQKMVWICVICRSNSLVPTS
jgi:hypothetical protein